MKTLCIGQTVVDESIVIEENIVEGQKISSSKTSYSIGGPAAAASIFFSKMGCDVLLATSLAKDRLGYFIKDELEKHNVKLFPTYQAKTQKNIVLTNKKNGVRTIIRDSVITKTVSLDEKIISQASIIYLDRHQVDIFDKLITHKNHTTPIIFDPSNDPSLKNLLILKQLEYPIIPWEFVVKWSKVKFNKAAKKFFKFLKKPFLITVGEFGTIFIRKRFKPMLFPAYDIKPVDTLGAGDIFRAAFGYFITQGKEIEKAIDFANKVSALHCQKKGNSSAVPDKKTVFSAKLKKKSYKIEDVFKSLDQIKI